jgi:hypothetical protein
MILNEIDYESSMQYVQQEITRIQQELLNNRIDKITALSDAEILNNSIRIEISLSDVNLEDKAKFITIFVMIALLIKDIKRYTK